jgi:uncharacterized protein
MPINRPYRDIAELPGVISVFPLEGALLLPRGELPLNIFEPRYMRMFDDAIASERLIGMIQPLPGAGAAEASPPLAPVGCLGRITQVAETGDSRYAVNLTGVARFRVIAEPATTTPYRRCRVDFSEFAGDLVRDPSSTQVDRAALVAALRQFAETRGLRVEWGGVERMSPGALINMASMAFPFDPIVKQSLLEARDMLTRGNALIAAAEMARREDDAPPRTLH